MTIFEAFAKLFGSDGRRQDWTAEEWAIGWAAISNDPPTVEQFNALQNISDQKANYLYRQISALSQSDTTPLSLDDNERLKRAIQLMIANAAIGVVNNLTSTSATQALSANQGRILSERINKAVPVGVVLHTAASSAPDGWLLCNGAAVSRATYTDLFAAIGTAYGAGNGSTTFNVPDLRGEFIRGADGGRGVDTGRAIGSAQASSMAAHTHGVGVMNNSDDVLLIERQWVGGGATYNNVMMFGELNGYFAGSMTNNQVVTPTNRVDINSFVEGGNVANNKNFKTSNPPVHYISTATQDEAGGETRPRNIALNAMIKT